MKPTRWNSARANKKWLAFTTTVTVLLLGCWIHSLLYYSSLYIPLRSQFLSVQNKRSWIIFGFTFSSPPPSTPSTPSTLSFESFKSEPIPSQTFAAHRRILFPMPLAGFSPPHLVILLPFWLILLGFLGLQWILLPKSLPPPKGEGNLPGTP